MAELATDLDPQPQSEQPVRLSQIWWESYEVLGISPLPWLQQFYARVVVKMHCILELDPRQKLLVMPLGIHCLNKFINKHKAVFTVVNIFLSSELETKPSPLTSILRNALSKSSSVVACSLRQMSQKSSKVSVSTYTTHIQRFCGHYRSTTGNSRHPELRTGGFCWSKVLLPTCPCWQQLEYLD